MPEPRFGNCRNCAAWDAKNAPIGQNPQCRRHPPQEEIHEGGHPRTWPDDGCFDFIEKPAPTTEDRHG